MAASGGRTRPLCSECQQKSAAIKRASGGILCSDCFCFQLEEEVHEVMIENEVIPAHNVVAVAVSGGKDSSAMIEAVTNIIKRHPDSYEGVALKLLAIDEGITGYRDGSLEVVRQHEATYELPLEIVSFQELFGRSLDGVASQLQRGHTGNKIKNTCTVCGVFRRKALRIGAERIGASRILLGHNANDFAETVLMNFMRGDVGRLTRGSNNITTGMDDIARSKPFKYVSQKEIVIYAHFRKVPYFCTECIYAPHAFRGHARELLMSMEKENPMAPFQVIKCAEELSVVRGVSSKLQHKVSCAKCGLVSSQLVCQSCVICHTLESGEMSNTFKSNRSRALRDIQQSIANDNCQNPQELF